MTRWKTQKMGRNRIQSGVPMRVRSAYYDRMNGLLMRGVVTATYEVDNTNHPILTLDPTRTPVAIYCDVLCYTSMVNQRWQMLKQVLVSQPVGGIHRGRIYKPRAATIDITGNDIDLDRATNPAFLDGDHVLVGFIDDSPNTPVILRGIPHPSNDVGNEEKVLGPRMKLKILDGDPDFWKHHGTFYGVEDDGSFVVDSRFANDGKLTGAGKEAAPPTDGKGSQRYKLTQDAEHEISLWDMADPDNPDEVARVVLNEDTWELRFAQGASLNVVGKDDAAVMTLGDGAVSVAVADHLQTLWNAMKATLDAWGGASGHVHPTGVGPSGTASPVLDVDSWDTAVNSDKALIPDTGP